MVHVSCRLLSLQGSVCEYSRLLWHATRRLVPFPAEYVHSLGHRECDSPVARAWFALWQAAWSATHLRRSWQHLIVVATIAATIINMIIIMVIIGYKCKSNLFYTCVYKWKTKVFLWLRLCRKKLELA